MTSKGAIEDLNKALELDPKNAKAYSRRGVAKLMLDDLKGAMTDLDKGIELNPNDAVSYINRGSAKVKLGDYKGQ